jgi:hypothetical protein
MATMKLFRIIVSDTQIAARKSILATPKLLVVPFFKMSIYRLPIRL